jgi:DNA repair protein RecO (recombination protein O)
MPGLYRDEGIVLKTTKLGEADRIVTLMTRNNGKVQAVAKGVRKTKSRFGGRLEPLSHVNLMIYRGRNLDTITSVEIRESFDIVRTDYARLLAAAALVEVVEKITPDRERLIPVYSLLVSGLQALARDKGASVVPAFMVKLLSVSGYHPQLTVCAGCGDAGPFGGFSPSLGGAVCEECWRQDRGAVRLAPDRIALLGKLLNSEFGEAVERPALLELTQVLRSYAEYHLERPLRSVHLFAAS